MLPRKIPALHCRKYSSYNHLAMIQLLMGLTNPSKDQDAHYAHDDKITDLGLPNTHRDVLPYDIARFGSRCSDCLGVMRVVRYLTCNLLQFAMGHL